MEQKTPLYDEHIKLSAKMVPYAGFLMPVQYPAGLSAEHTAVRTRAGIFDVSHMGIIRFSGTGALDSLNYIFTNDFTDMPNGRVRYSPFCNENGGVLDDTLVMREHKDSYLVVVNAANHKKDYTWFVSHVNENTAVTDLSGDYGQIALQGPCARSVLSKLTSHLPERYYTFIETTLAGETCIVSSTGYTGESGYEIICPSGAIASLWNTLLDSGRDEGLIPCGLGARDTLRLEAAMPLYGHELSEDITPFEAALDFAVKLSKPQFIGKTALAASLPVKRLRVGLRVTGKGIVREDCDVFFDGKLIGKTTSGTLAPHLGFPVAMAILDASYTAISTPLTVNVRGREITAEIVPIPFYKKSK